MGEYGKMAGFAAAGAFFVSLLVGLVSRNPFGVVVARALLFAVLFAGLAAGVRYIISKYLPELVSDTAPSAEGSRGQNVDITLPEENPVVAPRASAYSRVEPQKQDYSNRRAPEEEAEGTDAEDELSLDSEQPVAGSEDLLGDALDDVLPPLSDADSAPRSGAAASRAGSEAEEPWPGQAEELGGASDAGDVDLELSGEGGEGISDEGGDAGLADASDSGGLGRLPDISSLGGKSEPWDGPAGGPPRAELPSNPRDAAKGALGGRDPATLARAIRTVLKREEKG